MILNYVRMIVEPNNHPVKQCYNYFSYGHVASRPCSKERIYRDCGENYHSKSSINPKECVYCKGNHSSNNKICPKYSRQNIYTEENE